MKIQNSWFVMSLLGVSGLLGKCRKNLFEMANIQSAILYLRAVQGIRHSMIGTFQLVLGTMFFLAGIILLHFALFAFLNHETGLRSWGLFVLGLIEVAASAGYMAWFFSSKRWVRDAAHFHPVLKQVWAQRDEQK